MKNNELVTVLNLLKTMPCVGLKVPDISKILDLSEEMDRQIKVYEKERSSVFQEYGIDISEPDAQEKFFSHPSFEEISSKIREIDERDTVLTNSEFLVKSQVLKCVELMNGITPLGIQGLLSALIKTNQ